MQSSKFDSKNRDVFLEVDLSGYAGEWVVIEKGEVIASGDTELEAVKKAEEKAETEEFLVSKIPDNRVKVL